MYFSTPTDYAHLDLDLACGVGAKIRPGHSRYVYKSGICMKNECFHIQGLIISKYKITIVYYVFLSQLHHSLNFIFHSTVALNVCKHQWVT